MVSLGIFSVATDGSMWPVEACIGKTLPFYTELKRVDPDKRRTGVTAIVALPAAARKMSAK